MIKLFDKKKGKEVEEKAAEHPRKMVNVKGAKSQPADGHRQESYEAPRDLFWDDYSDVGYC